MMLFRFAPMLNRYCKPYLLVRPSSGQHNDDGVWEPAEPSHIPLRGHFQPVNAKLQQEEGGKYTEEDRALYTTNKHSPGELIEYLGVQYTIDSPGERDYCDVNKYIVKKVVANAPV